MAENFGKQVKVTSSKRGNKMVRSTGRDDSSYGDRSTKALDREFKGGPSDISSSIKNGKVREY